MSLKITDRDGDRLILGAIGNDRLLTLTTTDQRVASVYLDDDDARLLRDHLDELLGEERKASPETLDDARALLLQVGKDLVRKGLPEGLDGDVLLLMEATS